MNNGENCTIETADEWDLDHLRSTDPTRIEDTLRKCSACPMLLACRRYTQDCVESKKAPRAAVQGGMIFNAAGEQWSLKEYYTSVGGFQAKQRTPEGECRKSQPRKLLRAS